MRRVDRLSPAVETMLVVLGFTVLAMLLAFATFRWDPNAPLMRLGLRARVAKDAP